MPLLPSFSALPRRRPSLPRPLSPRGREGRKTKESFFFIPSSPSGRGGVGEVRAGGATTLKLQATMASDISRPLARKLSGSDFGRRNRDDRSPAAHRISRTAQPCPGDSRARLSGRPGYRSAPPGRGRRQALRGSRPGTGAPGPVVACRRRGPLQAARLLLPPRAHLGGGADGPPAAHPLVDPQPSGGGDPGYPVRSTRSQHGQLRLRGRQGGLAGASGPSAEESGDPRTRRQLPSPV